MEVDTPLGKLTARPGGNPHGNWTFGLAGEEIGNIGYGPNAGHEIIEAHLCKAPFIMDLSWEVGKKWDKRKKVEVKRHNNRGDNRGFTFWFEGESLGHIEYDLALGEVCLFFQMGAVHLDARWKTGDGWFFADDQVAARKAALKK